MDRPIREQQTAPAPPPNEQWPPAPVRPGGTPFAFCVEGIKVIYSDGTLRLTNLGLQGLFVSQGVLWLGWMLFSAASLLPVQGLSDSLADVALPLFGAPLLIGLLWLYFNGVMSRGRVFLDRSETHVQLGSGETAPLAQVQHVLIFSRSFFGVRCHEVYLVLGGGDSRNGWVRALSWLEYAIKTNARLLGRCRQGEHAQRIADALANVIGVHVQHRAD